MKRNNYLSGILLAATLGLAACSGKHAPLTEHHTKEGYAISAPSNYVEHNENPERFSFSYMEEDKDGKLRTELTVEADPKEAYEARRTKDGTLKTYPYTLTGFSNFFVNDCKRWQDFKELGRREGSIHGMPAIMNEMEFSMEGLPCHLYVATTQGANGMLYRIMIISHEGAITYADEIFQSFKTLQ